jgi:hypothetical protein
MIYNYVIGGADRDRTDDLLNAIQALSQLSYSPKSLYNNIFFIITVNSEQTIAPDYLKLILSRNRNSSIFSIKGGKP